MDNRGNKRAFQAKPAPELRYDDPQEPTGLSRANPLAMGMDALVSSSRQSNRKERDEWAQLMQQEDYIAIVPNDIGDERGFLALYYNEDGTLAHQEQITPREAQQYIQRFNAVPLDRRTVSDINTKKISFDDVKMEYWLDQFESDREERFDLGRTRRQAPPEEIIRRVEGEGEYEADQYFNKLAASSKRGNNYE